MQKQFIIQPVAVAGYEDTFAKALTVAEMLPVMELPEAERSPRIVELSIVNKAGHRIFADGAAKELAFMLFVPLFESANMVNGITEQVVEDAEGN